MDNRALRAARVLNTQPAMLHLRMETAKPELTPEGKTLFKRMVEVSPGADLPKLLEKWNPGVTDGTLKDLVGSVCRWNRLESPQSVRQGQKLLIPSVIPFGREPAAPRPEPPAPAKPGGIWITSQDSGLTTGGDVKRQFHAKPVQAAELQRQSLLRRGAPPTPPSNAGNSGKPPGGGIWVTNQNPGFVAGGDIKRQFQPRPIPPGSQGQAT